MSRKASFLQKTFSFFEVNLAQIALIFQRMAASGGGKKVLLSEVQIRKLLAQREPFLLVHRVIENVIGEIVTTVARQNDRLEAPSRLHVLEGLGQTSALLIKQVRHRVQKLRFPQDLLNVHHI